MKNIKIVQIWMLVIVLAFTTSCFKDNNIYNYSDNEVITVTGIDESYDVLSLIDRIQLDPVVESTDPNAQFEYFWGIYETSVQGYAPVLDTIIRTKSIDYLVLQPAKLWILVFGAKNINTGYEKIVQAEINVGTQYTRGWYVLKDNDVYSDVDLFLTPETIVPDLDSKIENVFSLVNNKQLGGKATMLRFYNNYKSDVTGLVGNTRAMFLVSEDDATVVDINTFKEIRGFNNLFFNTPEVKKPDGVFVGTATLFMLNNGELHEIYAMAPNIGVFGGRQLRDNMNSPYKLSKYHLGYEWAGPVLFDEISSSFVSTGSGVILSSIQDDANSTMSATNTNMDLLFMGLRINYPLSGYAVLQDKTDPTQKYLAKLDYGWSGIKITHSLISPTDKFYNANIYTCFQGDESMMYFVNNNEIWSRNLANDFEQLQFTPSAGEEVTYIRHKKLKEISGSSTPYDHNYMVVGTTSGGNYKAYFFQKSSGNLNATPEFVLEGIGNIRDVIYISPQAGGGSYPNTY